MELILSIIGIAVIVVVEGALLYWRQKRNKKTGFRKESKLYLKLSEYNEERKGAISDESYKGYKEIVEAEDISAIKHAECVIQKELGTASIFGIIATVSQLLVLAVGKVTVYSLVYVCEKEYWQENMSVFNTMVDITYQVMQFIILGYILFVSLLPIAQNMSKQKYFSCIIRDVLVEKEKEQINKIDKTYPQYIEMNECNNADVKADEQIRFKIDSSTPINEIHIKVAHKNTIINESNLN